MMPSGRGPRGPALLLRSFAYSTGSVGSGWLPVPPRCLRRLSPVRKAGCVAGLRVVRPGDCDLSRSRAPGVWGAHTYSAFRAVAEFGACGRASGLFRCALLMPAPAELIFVCCLGSNPSACAARSLSLSRSVLSLLYLCVCVLSHPSVGAIAVLAAARSPISYARAMAGRRLCNIDHFRRTRR